MGALCGGRGVFCRHHGNLGKMWDSRDGFHGGNGNSHGGGFDFCLAHGFCRGLGWANHCLKCQDVGVLNFVGAATGGSWLCYFKALQLGEVNKVVPIDKSSTVLTILLAFVFLHESVSVAKAIGVVGIALGTFLMIEKKDVAKKETTGHGWFFYAVGAAVFASLTAILGKVGIEGVESNLGTAIRTVVVLVMAWVMVFVTGKQHTLRHVPKKELGFICLSGLATGGSWLCYYHALQDGLASVVVPIDKLSILVTILFSYVVFHETLNRRSAVGLVAIVAGTLLMLF